MHKGLEVFQLAGVLAQEEVILAADPEIRLIKWMIVVLCILTIIIIGYAVFFRKKSFIEDHPSKWLLLIGFVVLSPIVYLINFGVAFEQSKPVSFCDSCHVMNGYVEDLKDPDSDSIASLHYHYRWISDNQCYNCHTDYGIFGTAEAKMTGIRHIWKYYIAGYETPIELRGTYNNRICLHCHGPVETYQDVEEHEEHFEKLEMNKESCFSLNCHVSPHPVDAWKVNEE